MLLRRVVAFTGKTEERALCEYVKITKIARGALQQPSDDNVSELVVGKKHNPLLKY